MTKSVLYIVAFLFVPLLVLKGCISISISAETGFTIRVPDDYLTIQDAINAANPGDTVVVLAGMYHEHVVVNKSISLVGENCSTTIIDGQGVGNVVSVNVANVSISGFTITNGENGIFLEHSDDCTISDNIAASNREWAGIFLNCSSGNSIYDNYILNNGRGPPSLRVGSGVLLYDSHNNTITENIIVNSSIDGITLYASSMNTISYNILMNNSNGVSLLSSRTNVLSHNNVTLNSSWGISAWAGSHNLIHDNQVSHNGVGIELYNSAKNIIRGNLISYSTETGIKVLDVSPNNVFTQNILKENDVGIYTHFSNNSVFYKNNLINNSMHTSLDGYPDVNIWDNGAEGNYWSGFTGDDSDGDGIIDIPHILDVRNRDNYPLAEPWSEIRTFPIVWDEVTYTVTVQCNSTVASLHFNQPGKNIGFNVTGPADSTGVCNVTMPLTLMWGYFSVLIDNVPQPYTIYQNQAHTSIYIVYAHTTHQIKIHSTKAIPEFSQTVLLTVFMIATVLAVIVYKRKHQTRNKKREV